MKSAGIIPEIDIQESESNPDHAPLANTQQPNEEINEERLSVFEDFLGSLDIGELDDDIEEDNPPDDEPEK
jgi:hypothetical protein